MSIVSELANVELPPAGKYEVHTLPMSEIFHDPTFNCRGRIIPMEVLDLAKDIKARGLDQPIVVRPYTDPLRPQYKYKVVAGHRRHMAHQVNNSETIVSFVRDDLSEMQARLLNFRENLHRVDLNMKQEAHALNFFLQYKKEGTQQYLFTEGELAQIFGKSRGWVQNRKDLLKLPEDVQNEAAAGILTADNVKHLARIRSTDDIYALVRKIKDTKARGDKVSLKPSITRVNDVLKSSVRDKSQVDEMNGLIYDILGPCLATRFGAWCSGHISTSEMFCSIEQECKDLGKPFKMPKFVNDAITGVRSNEGIHLMAKEKAS